MNGASYIVNILTQTLYSPPYIHKQMKINLIFFAIKAEFNVSVEGCNMDCNLFRDKCIFMVFFNEKLAIYMFINCGIRFTYLGF